VAKHKQESIRIINPIDGRGRKSRKNAERYVKRGLAVIRKDNHGEYLEFTNSDKKGYVGVAVQRESDAGHDIAKENGLACLDAIRRLPIAGDPLRLLMTRSKVTRCAVIRRFQAQQAIREAA